MLLIPVNPPRYLLNVKKGIVKLPALWFPKKGPVQFGDGLEFKSSSQIQVIAGMHLNSFLCSSPIEREALILNRQEAVRGYIQSPTSEGHSLEVGGQSLAGSLPPIGNLTFLRELVLSNNNLQGSIPTGIGLLRRMRHLNLSTNSLQGEIPIELTNCSNLKTVDLTRNNLTGQIPLHVGHMLKLLLLWLGVNDLTGVVPFTLGNLSSLQHLSVAYNHLEGNIPHELGRLKSLKYLYLDVNNLSGNQFTGVIPDTLSNISGLEHLDLGNNYLTGQVPDGLGVLKDLYWLNLEFNNLGRGMPSDLNFLYSLPNISSFRLINLQANNFGGVLPISIVNRSTQLEKLIIGDNKISGSIPKEIGNLISLTVFSAMRNNLTGVIPTSIGKLQNLRGKSRGTWQLFGIRVPRRGKKLLPGNHPLSFSSLRGIQTLDLSCNNLSGTIPKELQHLSALLSLNLSYNHLEGEVPSGGVFKNVSEISITGNKKLCGGIPQLQLPACSDVESAKHGKGKHLSTKIVIAISITGVSCLAFIVASVLPLWEKKGSNEVFFHFFKIWVLEGFLQRPPQGNYEGTEPSTRGAAKSFMAECKVLRNIQHRNLLRIITSCSSVDKKDTNCSWGSKAKQCLLDDDMVVHVGDFGLAKLIPEATEIQVVINQFSPADGIHQLCGSSKKINICMGEYGIGGSMWPQGDMYSYGILLLEMLTGKRPTEHMFLDGLSLHSFSKMALPERVMEIADSNLVGESGEAINNIANRGDMEGRVQHCLASIARIGVACSEESPGDRMDIKDVVMELNIIKEVFLG
ncbi:Receptor kinase-like protein Xa21 [Vitis vinifera]|uniref:non-specific serine/threonine protein kinase n=1 Tax=Vitis vinifera TaxID=29760 RepID=A0A438FX00_VITVI|nr:Receptor kinase-like protein Xa21 [Vitis vinifera]